MTAPPPSRLGTLSQVHRYPVKSLAGERLDRVVVGRRGLDADRLWSVQDPDGKLGSGKSSRRFRRMAGLLMLRAEYDGPTPVVTFPDGRVVRGDDDQVHGRLSEYVGRPVRLAEEGRVSHFDEGPVHLVTTASLAAVAAAHGAPVDPRHCRPSFVVDTGELTGTVEEELVGRPLRIGEVVLQPLYPMPRCVMLDMEQVDLPPSPRLLRTVNEHNGGNLGVVATVLRSGTVTVGDAVTLA